MRSRPNNDIKENKINNSEITNQEKIRELNDEKMADNQKTETETINKEDDVEKNKQVQKDSTEEEIKEEIKNHQNEEKKGEIKEEIKEEVKGESVKEIKEETNKKEKNIDSLVEKVINVVEDESISNQSINDKKTEIETTENKRKLSKESGNLECENKKEETNNVKEVERTNRYDTEGIIVETDKVPRKEYFNKNKYNNDENNANKLNRKDYK